MPGRVGLLVNPTSGKGSAGPLGVAARGLLTARDIPLTDLSGPDAATAEANAREAVSAGAVDTLVVVGGDGLVNLGANVVAGTQTSLGIVAAGTGNDIARELGLPIRDPAAAVARICDGSPTTVDAVRVETSGEAPRWFVGVLAAGFDAVVNERANRWSWPRGRGRYNLAVLRELPVFRPIPYSVRIDGVDFDGPAMLVAVGNLAAYGGGMKVTPDARHDDGLVDVLVLSEVSIPEFLRVFPRVFAGTHVRHPAVTIHRGTTVRLSAPGIVAYADGERFGPLPADLVVVPGALRVLT